MINFKWSTVIQLTFTVLGVTMGLYFSIKANKKHFMEHDKIDNHTSIHHGYIDVSNDSIIPKIEHIELIKDPMSGWNLHIITKKFQFTPEKASTKHIPGEGHAHLLINGEKVARIYSKWFHLPIQAEEINELEITLNANTHAIMINNEKPIALKVEEKLLPTGVKNP